jgi:hypothetical protein
MHLRIGQLLPRLANGANNSTRLLWLTTRGVQKIRLDKWTLRIAEDTSSGQTCNISAGRPVWERESSKSRNECGTGEETDTNEALRQDSGSATMEIATVASAPQLLTQGPPIVQVDIPLGRVTEPRLTCSLPPQSRNRDDREFHCKRWFLAGFE